MSAIPIHELHEDTALRVSKATEHEPVVLTDLRGGRRNGLLELLA